MKIEDSKLTCSIDGKEFSFSLPPYTNYPKEHHLVIPLGKEFVHLIVADDGWQIGETVSMGTVDS